MNKLLLVLVAAAALVGTGIYLVHKHQQHHVKLGDIPTPAYDAWIHWKNTHQKFYASKQEEAKRLAIFYENYKKIQNHQQKNDRTYDMGFNKFMDLSTQEFKSLYLTLKPIQLQSAPRHEVVLNDANLPTSLDWRSKGAVTPVKDQGQCGSCWAFSTVGALEGLNFVKNGKLQSFAEQQLVDCSGSYGNEGCNGGLMDQAFQYVEQSGITTEDKYPYTAEDGSCKSPSPVFKITGFNDIQVGSDSQLQAACAQQPVSIAVDAESWQFYTGGIFSDCSDSLDHGVTLIGYQQGSYWLVKNSWGTGWGESGLIRLKWGNTCGLENAASYPTL